MNAFSDMARTRPSDMADFDSIELINKARSSSALYAGVQALVD